MHLRGSVLVYNIAFRLLLPHVSNFPFVELELMPSNTEHWGEHPAFHQIKTSVLVEEINAIKNNIIF